MEKTAVAESGTESGQQESRSGAGMRQAARLSLLYGYHWSVYGIHKVLHGYRTGQRAKMPKKISGFHLCFENTNIWGEVCRNGQSEQNSTFRNFSLLQVIFPFHTKVCKISEWVVVKWT